MQSSVTIRHCIDDGLVNLKENFWAFILIVIILGIFDAVGNGPAYQQGSENQ